MNATPTKADLRKFPNGFFVHYRVFDKDKKTSSVVDSKNLTDDALKHEVLALYKAFSVLVDGVVYKRSATLYNANFYTVVDDFTYDQPDDGAVDPDISWDSQFVFSHKCERCKKRWLLAEEQFLATGEIRCQTCQYLSSKIY